MAQWFAFKDRHPDALLFFRMGDFYELFFDDAEAAASALSIALTARGRHADRPIPMCGVPVASSDAYLGRLIRRGFRVAIVEQTEPGPSAGGPKRTGRTPLRRDVVRLVTPGTLTEEALLDAGRPSLLAALVPDPGTARGRFGVAIVDVAAGAIETERVGVEALPELLARTDPAEILAGDGVPLGEFAARRAPDRLAPPPLAARARAAESFGSASLDAFGTFSDAEAMAIALALDYVRAAGAGRLPRLAPPVPRRGAGFLSIDASTRASLALTAPASPGGDGADAGRSATLLGAIDRTMTAAGARLLASRIAAPLDDRAPILARQEEWVALNAEPARAATVATALRGAPDGARALGRLSLDRASPRDFAAIRDALAAAVTASRALDGAPPALAALGAVLGRGEALREALARALAADPPVRFDDGDTIADGVDPELDAARALARDSRRAVAALGTTLAARYGVPGLKIRHHAQLGFVIEVGQGAADALRARPELILRQGLAGGARFGSAELATLDARINDAASAARTRERALIEALARRVLDDAAPGPVFAALAALDVALNAASLAAGGTWCRPAITEDATFALVACRHPVVEAALPPRERFVPNDCDLAPERRLVLLTGPNMAGKSTFLRQTALAVVLAQAGLPVPASTARIGLVDRLFSRVGAADDLVRGRSTFMVEMTETAAILHAAGPRSLVVVDEIGRGTSTLDGLAIATAVLEALHGQVRCRGIFATHFHELAAAAERLPRLALRTMRVREWRGEVVFQHEVLDGVAERSWGVHVARLAGVPAPVVGRARALLASLEGQRRAADTALPLFRSFDRTEAAAPAGPPVPDPVASLLADTDPDALSPRDAHALLCRLKAMNGAVRDGLSVAPRDD